MRLAIFASGNGSNAQQIIDYFASDAIHTVSLILCNKPGAYVLERAQKNGILSITFSATDLSDSDLIINALKQHHIDFIVLAGFLLKIPHNILHHYPNRILNIHPALLPKYGGKGMYGNRVHKAVIDSGEPISGITIHLVNEHYDEGQIVFQAKCPVMPNDTPESLAERIHQLEHLYYPKVISDVISKVVI